MQGGPAASPMGGTPVVLVHGLFGWGERRPLFGAAPPYFPLRRIRGLWTHGPVVAVDVGAASSDHDRACEAFAQLRGAATDYGEEHARRCGHTRFGPDFSDRGALLRRWDATHPVHLVGHSFGGNTIVTLLSLLAEDHWGLGTGPEWVLSVTCICSPLRGCSLVYAIAFDEASTQPGAKLTLRRGSPSHVLSMIAAVFLRAQVRWPALPLKGIYDLRCDHWGCKPIDWKGLKDGDHPYWQSGDNVAVNSTPAHSRRTHGTLQHLGGTRLIAVVADPLPPLSPSAAAMEAVPYGLASLAVALAGWQVRRVWWRLLKWLFRQRKKLAFPAVALAAIAASRFLTAEQGGQEPTDRWQSLLETCGPWLHKLVMRPAMRLMAHAIQKASDTLDVNDKLATRCGGLLSGNDGLIDVAAQRWLDAPVCQSSKVKLNRERVRRCTRSTEQDLSSRYKALANSFSNVDVRQNEEASPTLKRGKWHVIHVSGADHCLGTSVVAESIDMYRSVFALLGPVSRGGS